MNVKVFLAFILSFILFQFCVAQDDDEYVFKNKGKTNKKSISNKSIYDIPNPDYTSYFLSPTAFTITKRDFRLASNDIIFFKATYGLTDKTNISLNTTLFGSVIGSLKHSIDIDENQTLSFSASFGDFTASIKDTNILFTGADACFTFGDHQNNISVGTGFYYIKSSIDIFYDRKEFYAHVISFGLQNQIAKKTYIMVDGYYFTNYSILTAAAGFKFVIRTRYTLNAGIMPVLWNDIRSSRYNVKPTMIPVISFRMLIERF